MKPSVFEPLRPTFSVIFALLSLIMISGCDYEYTGDGYEVVKEIPGQEPWFTVYRPLNLNQVIEDRGQLLPTIVWGNGGCFRSEFTWRPLFKRWAAEGYVVLALSEAPLLQGGPLGITNVADHRALIDWALQSAPYTDMLDPTKVIAAGNSCGGVTALGVAAEDTRVAGVFVLSGSSALGSSSKKIMEAVTVPVGYVTGGPSDVAGGPAKKDYALLDEQIPAMIVNHVKVGHLNVSTDVSLLEQAADVSYHWMDLILYGNEDSYNELMSETICSLCTPDEWEITSRQLDTLIQ